MAAPPINIQAIVDAVYTILSTDARTAPPVFAVWYPRRRDPDKIQLMPAAMTYLDALDDVPFSMPEGRVAGITVGVFLQYTGEAGPETGQDPETQMYNGLDLVTQVLQDNQDLGRDDVVNLYLTAPRFELNSAATPPIYRALLRVKVQMVPRGPGMVVPE